LSTADRLLGILDLFSLDQPDWSVEDAAAAVGAPTSTAYRYFNSLTKSGLVTPVGGGRYILGPAIIRYDRQLRLTDPILRFAPGEMERLAKSVTGKGVVFLCRLFDNQVMCVAQASDGSSSIATSYERGRLMPLFAGSASRVILANLSTAKVRTLFERQGDEFRAVGMGDNLDEVKETLKAVRNEGHYVTAGEVDPGMRGISVPVFIGGKVTGSLSIAGPRQNFSTAQIARAVSSLKDASQRIADDFQRWMNLHGARGPDAPPA
jgi:DNA-binding IclR family transcriptional regulator